MAVRRGAHPPVRHVAMSRDFVKSAKAALRAAHTHNHHLSEIVTFATRANYIRRALHTPRALHFPAEYLSAETKEEAVPNREPDNSYPVPLRKQSSSLQQSVVLSSLFTDTFVNGRAQAQNSRVITRSTQYTSTRRGADFSVTV